MSDTFIRYFWNASSAKAQLALSKKYLEVQTVFTEHLEAEEEDSVI